MKTVFAFVLCCTLTVFATMSHAGKTWSEQDSRVLLGNMLLGTATVKIHTHARLKNSRGKTIEFGAVGRDRDITIKSNGIQGIIFGRQ